MRPRPLSQRSNLLLLLAFPLLHWLLSLPANVIWQPPAGLRFGLLLLLPRRYWLLMAIWLELAYRLVGQAGEWRGLAAFTAGHPQLVPVDGSDVAFSHLQCLADHVLATGLGP